MRNDALERSICIIWVMRVEYARRRGKPRVEIVYRLRCGERSLGGGWLSNTGGVDIARAPQQLGVFRALVCLALR